MVDTTFALNETPVDKRNVQEFQQLLLHHSMQERVAPPVETTEIHAAGKKETNPILLVFKLMIVAKGILRKGLQETKESNRRNERQWEAIALKIQEEHKNTASFQKKWSYAYAIAPVIQVFGVLGGQWIAGKDRAWRAVTKTQAENFFRPLPGFTQIIPTTIESFLDAKNKSKKIEDFATSISQFGNQFTQGTIDHFRVSNEAAQAPLQQKSQSSSSLYQNRGSEESSEKQQLQEVDRSLRDLMSQEAQVFQGSSGRG